MICTSGPPPALEPSLRRAGGPTRSPARCARGLDCGEWPPGPILAEHGPARSGRPAGGAVGRHSGILETHFFALDLLVGFSLPVIVHVQNRSRPEGPVVIALFWLGAAIGLTWELPLFLSAWLSDDPVVGFIREPPLHPLVFMVAHALWDAGLFMAGLVLVRVVCAAPVLTAFRWSELAVLIVWGQTSALAVEVVSILNRAWVYSGDLAWNPVLFSVAGHPVTLVPQLVWLAAPIVYYLCALQWVRKAARDASRRLSREGSK